MFTLLFSLLLTPISTPVIANSSTYYARILSDDTYLYKSPNLDENFDNIYFELPKTYFVELLDSPNENFYSARYLNINGYVKKDSVQAVENVPNTPFLENINFRVYAEMSRELRSAPTTKNSSLNAYIPLLSRNLTYIGEVDGECLIEGRTKKWFYCKYTADKDYFGYVYSDFCDELSPITNNTEEVTYIVNPTFKKVEENLNSIPTSSNIVGIIIGILSIPALIFVIMIAKGKTILTNEKHKNKEVIDY